MAACNVTVSDDRAAAIREVASHYIALYGSDPTLAKLREQYAMSDGVLPGATDRAALAAFFFWTSWAAVTDRPGETHLSYTSSPTLPAAGAAWSTVSRAAFARSHR